MDPTPNGLSELVNADRQAPFDLLVQEITIVDVIAGELRSANVAVRGAFIAYVGPEAVPARQVIDGRGRFLAPGFMDAHIHTESTMLSLPEFARAVLPHGTTAVFADPHEIANVFGLAGIRLFLDGLHALPLRVYVQVPSRVPTAAGLEGTGGALSVEDTAHLLDYENVVSLGEIPVSLLLDPSKNADLFLKIAAARSRRKPINGHAPAKGRALAAFVSSGIGDDHTCIALEDGISKIRAGLWIMIKESSLDRNLTELHPLLQRYPHRCNLCTDDILPPDLVQLGHMDHLIRKAVGLGVDPVRAIAAATFNTAQRHHLEESVGSLTPGKLADMVILSDLRTVSVEQVYVGGRLVADRGRVVVPLEPWILPGWATDSVRLPQLSRERFLVPAETDTVVRVIELIPGGGARNRGLAWELPVEGGCLRCRDKVNHLTVINRYGVDRSANAFCLGFDLVGGALGSSIAHDHHNVVIVGDNPDSMLVAARAIESMHGGVVAVRGTDLAASLPLPIAGLMADAPLPVVAERLGECEAAARELGCRLDSPFISLSFVGLPSMPAYGLTDIGLVDVEHNAIVPVALRAANVPSAGKRQNL